MTRRMPREHQRTCPECGYTTPVTTLGMAESWLVRHSCDQQRERDRRVAAVAARRAESGPVRDCQHPVARHEHGTRLAYITDKCRCRPCRDANAGHQSRIDRLKAYGQWDPLTDAEPVREHVRWLMGQGMGWQRIARISGVYTGAMTKILYGKRLPDGTRRAPTQRVRHETAALILAVQPELDLLGRKALVDGTGTRRRLQALICAGWSQAKLANLLGMTGSNFGRVVRHEDRVQAHTARIVRDLYEQLWDTPPPLERKEDRIAASRARALAGRRGWLPALAWDDDTIDDPAAWANETTEEVLIDEMAVERFIGGDIAWQKLTVDERLEAAVRMDRLGYSRKVIHETCHVNQQTLSRALVEANGRRSA